MVNKKQKILSNQDKLLDAILNKDGHALRKLIHPEATVFGSAINEFEKGIDRVIYYYTQSIALLPDKRRIELKWRNFSDLGDLALVEQEFIVQFTLEDQEITLLTLRQSALWTHVPQENNQEDQWLLFHDHTSMPDPSGAFENISSSEKLESNLNLELETDQLKKRLNQTLSELKIVKDQLVQKERLASLGQLTAGIAHEIKNPLNFVNNFSEVSLEMIEEAREEVRRVTEDRGPESEKGKGKSEKKNSPFSKGDRGGFSDSGKSTDSDSNADPDLLLEILNDIEANLKKIHEHGTRADSIVKSMLQHSRGGTGKMEPTDLNALIKEYVNLSFHGMRAGKHPINVDIDLQLDESINDVPIIAEDFSRVLVNLCNNAFDAMRTLSAERSAQSENYNPKLTVRTKSDHGKVTIEIEDNGPGIPEDMKEKILQPFFTTKKGTEGTGLGLSITNDIIKAHGGDLKIQSESNVGTTFIIKLTK